MAKWTRNSERSKGGLVVGGTKKIGVGLIGAANFFPRRIRKGLENRLQQ